MGESRRPFPTAARHGAPVRDSGDVVGFRVGGREEPVAGGEGAVDVRHRRRLPGQWPVDPSVPTPTRAAQQDGRARPQPRPATRQVRPRTDPCAARPHPLPGRRVDAALLHSSPRQLHDHLPGGGELSLQVVAHRSSPPAGAATGADSRTGTGKPISRLTASPQAPAPDAVASPGRLAHRDRDAAESRSSPHLVALDRSSSSFVDAPAHRVSLPSGIGVLAAARSSRRQARKFRAYTVP
jgi:hypothetical protein